VPLPTTVRLQAGVVSVALAEIHALVHDTDAANQVRRPVALTRSEQRGEFRKAAGDVLKSSLRMSIYSRHTASTAVTGRPPQR